jgi:cytochrome c oxidase subunit 3/cytochrome o ubiquinol oxidase subunit 3
MRRRPLQAAEQHSSGGLLGQGYTSTGLPTIKVAMWLFLASESLLFGGLITAYVLFHGRATTGPTAQTAFNIPYTSVSAFVLLASSLTMVLALAAIQRGQLSRFRVWILATAMLGMTFIAGQIYEFTTFIDHGMTLKTNVFASSFYLLTGTHGVHVTMGILMLLTLLVLSYRGSIDADHAFTVEMVGLYWHFVDIVWIIIFTVVYLIPAAKHVGA